MSETQRARAPDASQEFERHRPYLMRLAYRMLGSIAEAEDAVQDGYLRWHRQRRDDIENPRAFLGRVVTRLCLDRLKQARTQREHYVGVWLPEPLVEDWSASAQAASLIERDVSTALMMALERLSPLERAAFILHDIFDMAFDEVALALGRTESACRQLASRARSSVMSDRPRFPIDHKEGERLADAFFAAARSGDATGLQHLLAETATFHSDGGGRKLAALRTIVGADRISRMYSGLARKQAFARPFWTRKARIDGLPGMLSVEHDGTLQTTAIQLEEKRIQAIFVVRNPDKLRHLETLLPTDVVQRITCADPDRKDS